MTKKHHGRRPTVERLREALDYDPLTGRLTWKVRVARPARVGAEAGTTDPRGYRQVQLDGCQVLAHIVIWALVTGEWPDFDLDHRDLNRANNRWVNLRPATGSQNAANTKRLRSNTTGFKGTTFAVGKYQASITVEGKYRYLGRFESAEEAHAAYARAAQEAFGDYARVE